MGIPLAKEDGLHALTCPTYATVPTPITLSTSSNTSAQLGVGEYVIASSVDCYFLQGASDVAANVDHVPLYAGKYLPLAVPNATTHGYVAAIVSAGAGTVKIIQLSDD